MKRFKLLYILPVAILSLFWTGCDINELLDEQPNNEVMVHEVEHFRKMLVPSLYNTWFSRSSYGQLPMADYLYWDDAVYNYVAGINLSNNYLAYTWEDEIYTEDAAEPWDWSNNYEIIYKTNYILERIDDAPALPNQEELRYQIKGQALALRAYAFFALVNNYAKHYNPATADSDPGIPMPLVVSDETPPRSTVEEVYAQIVKDAEEAAAILQDLPDNFLSSYASSVPSRAGVKGFLSRVYLYMATDNSSQSQAYLQKAKEAAQDAMSIYSYLYNLNEEIMPDGAVHTGHKEILWYKNSSSGLGNGLTGFSGLSESSPYVDVSVLELYENDKDLRALNYYHNLIELEDRVSIRKSSIEMGIYMPEVILNKAEAEARLGELNEAFTTANILREKRFSSDSDYELNAAGLSQAQVIQEILDEKVREFVSCEFRWWDMKRLIVLGEYDRILTRTKPDGTTVTLAPGDAKYVLEIPKVIREFNPDLTNR